MTIQIHRFHDKVAIRLGYNQTVYITQEQAREFAEKLIECADDIECINFTQSKFKTFEMGI